MMAEAVEDDGESDDLLHTVRRSFSVDKTGLQTTALNRFIFLASLASTLALLVFDIITEIASCNDSFYQSDKVCEGVGYAFYIIVRLANYTILFIDPYYNDCMIRKLEKNKRNRVKSKVVTSVTVGGLFCFVGLYKNSNYSNVVLVIWVIWICMLSEILFLNTYSTLTTIEKMNHRFKTSTCINRKLIKAGKVCDEDDAEKKIQSSLSLIEDLEAIRPILYVKFYSAIINCGLIIACDLTVSKKLNFIDFSTISIILNIVTFMQIINVVDRVKLMSLNNNIHYNFCMEIFGVEVNDYSILIPIVTLGCLIVKEFVIA